MEKAIEKAIEGGYPHRWYIPSGMDFHEQVEFTKREFKEPEEILLDPLFWQCLGKQQGWKENVWICHIDGVIDGHNVTNDEKCDFCKTPVSCGKEWVFKMHRLIDHIIEGKSVDSFFEELLK